MTKLVYEIKWRFSLKDAPRSDRPSDVDEDDIKALIELNHPVTVREIEEKLKIQIKSLGLVKRFVIWVPHELKEVHLTNRISACDMHLKRNEFDAFLKRISLVLKNGLFTITSVENNHGPSTMMRHKPLQRLIFTK